MSASAAMSFFVVMSISSLSSSCADHSRYQIVGGGRAGGCDGNHNQGA
jgi:hypothetical protein